MINYQIFSIELQNFNSVGFGFWSRYIFSRNLQHILKQKIGIIFLPTYKFENSHTYNYSKEKYIPSYCDRIFIRSNEQAVIKQLKYDSIDRFESDHQPVVALFFIDVKQIDKQKEGKLIQEFNKKNKELQQEEIQLYQSTSNLTVEEPQQQVQEQQQDPVIVQKKSLTQKLKDKLFK